MVFAVGPERAIEPDRRAVKWAGGDGGAIDPFPNAPMTPRCDHGFFTIRVRKNLLGSVPLNSPGLVGVQLMRSELDSSITSNLLPDSWGIAAGGLAVPARAMRRVAR